MPHRSIFINKIRSVKMKKIIGIVLVVIISLILFINKNDNSPLSKSIKKNQNKKIQSINWQMFEGTQKLQRYASTDLGTAYKLKWSFNKHEGLTVPIFSDNKIYVGTGNGKVYVFTLESNKPVKILNICNDTVTSQPLVYKNNIYIGTITGNFYSYNIIENKIDWKINTEGKITGSANYYQIDNQLYILFGSYDGYLYSIEALTGKKQWTVETDDFINGTPAIFKDNSRAVFGGCDGLVRVVNLRTGKQEFVYKLKSHIPSSPVIKNNNIICTEYSNKIVSFSFKDMYVVTWKYKSNKKGVTYIHSPAVSDNYLVTGDERGYLRVIELKTGKLKTEKRIGKKINTPLIFKNNRILVTTSRGVIKILDLTTLDVVWKYKTKIPIEHGAIPVNNGFAVTDNDGNLYVFEKKITGGASK